MGKLNILHHKSWHVYKRENRLRVLKDEENAKKEEEEKLQKKLKSEREERLNLLQISKGKEVNFTLFPEQESTTKETNTAQEIKNDPWIMKLGETRTGEKADPWYSKPNVKEFTQKDQYSLKDLPKSYSSKMSKEKDERIKARQDPLLSIKHSLDSKEKSSTVAIASKDGSSSKDRNSKSIGSSIEELRRKRIEREKKESLKSMELFTGKSDSEKSKDFKLHERDQDYYHSQFNRDSIRRRTK